jgi:hypothetical protein
MTDRRRDSDPKPGVSAEAPPSYADPALITTIYGRPPRLTSWWRRLLYELGFGPRSKNGT